MSKGKLTRDKADKALSLLKGVLDYTSFKDVDMVIEVDPYLHCAVGIFLFVNFLYGSSAYGSIVSYC